MRNILIYKLSDLVRVGSALDEEFTKAQRPPGGGWKPVGRKGGYKRVRGGKAEYWYPNGAQKPSKAKTKPSTKKRGRKPQKGAQGEQRAKNAKPMKPYASKAPQGSARWRLETGKYQLIRKRVFSRDMDDHQRRKTSWAPNVDDETKMELVEQYEPLIRATAKKISRRLHLPWTQSVKDDLHSAGVEGMLVAIDKYQGGTAFNPSTVVHDMMRVHAAQEFLGFELPAVHVRNLARYIAARHQAVHKLGKMEPTPEDVLPFFDLRKRHIHPNVPAHDKTKVIGKQPKKILNEHGFEVPNPKAGEPIYAPLRNAQVPDHDRYTLPVGHLAGTAMDRGARTRHARRQEQPSKLEWAEMYHSFLMGEKGISVFEESVVAPGAGVGYGFSPEDQAIIGEDLAQAAEIMDQMMSDLGKATIEAKSYPGAKKKTIYRVESLGDIAMRRLGINREEHSIQALVRAVPIEKKTKTGWKRVGDRQAHDLMQKFVDMAVHRLPKHATGAAKSVAKRAANIVAPRKSAPRGPSYREIIKKEAAKISDAQVQHYRSSIRSERVQHLLRRMTNDEVRTHMARASRRGQKLSAEMRRAMTQFFEVERTSPTSGIARVYNPSTGQWDAMKVRMSRPRPDGGATDFVMKSLDGFYDGTLLEMHFFPRTAMLLTSDGLPTKARRTLHKLVGLG